MLLACMTVSALLFGTTACGPANKTDKTVEQETEEKEDKDPDKDGEKENDKNPDESKDSGDDQKEPESVKNPVYPIEIYKQDFYDSYWEDISLAEVEYDLIYVGEGAAAEFSDLEDTLKARNAEIKDSMTSAFEEYSEMAKEVYQSNPEYFYGPFTLEHRADVMRCDNRVVCIGNFSYDYGGGAHGYYSYSGFNVDSVSGQELKISDVVKDVKSFPELLYEKLVSENPDTGFWENTKEYLAESFDETDTTLAWSIDYSGVSFYFNPYEVASYADGLIEVNFSFGEYPDLFNSYYTEIPNSFIAHSFCDLNKDGKIDTFSVFPIENEYGDIEKMKISINDNTIERDVYAYGLDYWMVHTKEDKFFLYVQLIRENDFRSMEVYDMNGQLPVYLGELLNVGFGSVCMDADNLEYAMIEFTNPEEFVLESRMSIFSTYSAYKTYHVGSDGMPVSDDKFYRADYVGYPQFAELKTKKEVTGMLVDETGSETGAKFTIAAGTAVRVCATDGDTFVDLEALDKRVRVYVVWEEWPQTIDGVDIEELFEGIMFAG